MMGPEVKVYGYTMRYGRLAQTAYPEVWKMMVETQRDTLARKIRDERYQPVGSLITSVHYAKYVELDEKPDWAAENDPGPWYEEVECESGDPDWETLIMTMETACAPR